LLGCRGQTEEVGLARKASEQGQDGAPKFRACTLFVWARELAPDENEEEEEEEEGRTFRSMLAFLFGMDGGPENMGMPRDVLRVVVDLLMPTWDPLRRKHDDAGQQLQG